MVSRTEYSAGKSRLEKLLLTTIDLARELDNTDLAEQLATAQVQLSREELRLVVCGEFKRGKSSLINALLEQPNLFPVDVDITTSVVTTISYAEQEKVHLVRSSSDGNPETLLITRPEIPDFVTESANPKNHRRALQVSIKGPFDSLSPGLMVVDTPGVGGINIEHSAITYSHIGGADVVLFVCQANQPMSSQEILFIERIKENCKHILFAMTKIDQVSDFEAVLESNRQKLSIVLDQPASDIDILPVSSSLKLAHLKSGLQIDLEESNFPEFEERLWRELRNRRGTVLLERGVGRLREAIEELASPVRVELSAYEVSTQQELNEIEKQLDDSMAALKEVQANEGQWKRELTAEINELRTQVGTALLMRQRLRVKSNFQSYLDDDNLIKTPQTIGSHVVGDLGLAVQLINDEIDSRGRAIQKRLIDTLDAQIESNYTTRLSVSVESPDLSHVATMQKSDGIYRKLDYGRRVSIHSIGSASLGAAAGGLVGAILGSFIMPGLGTLAGFQQGLMIGGGGGSLFGSAFGIRRGIDDISTEDDQLRRQELRTQLDPLIEETFVDIQAQLSTTISVLSDQIVDDLQSAVQAKIESLGASIETFREARKRTKVESQEHARALREILGRTEGISQELDRIERQSVTTQTMPHSSIATELLKKPIASGGVDNDLDYGDWAEEDGF
ncbi:MAG: hypothetical protein EA415_05505 [Sphaerobacteraceae bacterium]|nr:MAG: hypothetical protein EA415_05505 [Sphaerobacteraceae bacterium]